MTLPSAAELESWFQQDPLSVLGVAWIGTDPRDPAHELPVYCYFPVEPSPRIGAIARASGLGLLSDGAVPVHRIGISVSIAAHTAALQVLGRRPFDPIPLEEAWTHSIASWRHCLVLMAEWPLEVKAGTSQYIIPARTTHAAVVPTAFL